MLLLLKKKRHCSRHECSATHYAAEASGASDGDR